MARQIFTVSFLFCQTLLSLAQSDLANITSAFKSVELVPDVLPSFAPSAVVGISFGDLDVKPGSSVLPSQLTTPPSFTLDAEARGQNYVVAIVDPDAPTPSNRNVSEVRHFLGGNFTLSDGVLTNTSAALSSYIVPAPPPDSPAHRYAVLVYVQPANFSAAAATLDPSPLGFNISRFAASAGLGSPVAGTYFLAAPETTGSTGSSAATGSSTAAGSSTATGSTATRSAPSVTPSNGAISVSSKVYATAALLVVVAAVMA